MKFPSASEFLTLRRALPVIAAVLLVVAIFLPMWEITVLAVQYPGEPLELQLYAYPRISGDVWEIGELNQYVGFYYPDPVYWQPNYEPHPRAIDVPEWSLGPLAFLAVAAAGAFVAIAPTTEKLKRGLKWQLVGSVAVFTVLMVDIQYRLYQAGHNLDPDAPLVGIEGFTPPLWGQYEVANITSHSRLGVGAYLTIVAIGLLVIAYHFRDSEATFLDIPRLISGGIGRRIGRKSRGEEEPPEEIPGAQTSDGG